jgi:hypothetical protein
VSDLPLELGAEVAYAAPAGSAEKASRVSDTTFALAAFDADASYRFSPTLAAVFWGRYGIGVPTLCATASDCTSSLGRDVAVAARVRVFFPHIGRLEPRADVGIGWEWSMAKLSDTGVVSRRTWSGPIPLSLEAAAPFRVGKVWTIGPVLAATAGVFTQASLETPSFSVDRSTEGLTLHTWLSVAFRVSTRF